MFWGFFSQLGRGSLRVVEGTMDSKQYKKILREELFAEYQHIKSLGINCIVMQDNAPCHRAWNIKEYIREAEVDMLDWPPYSPDLNPIENVWGLIKFKLYSEFEPARSKEQLIDNVFELWESLDTEMCLRYCKNYNKRLKAVIEANGLYTKY